MFKTICELISEKLLSKTSLSKEEKTDYKYGLEIFFRLLVEVIILLILAHLFNIFWPVFAAAVTFVSLRSKAGGAHFPTYLQCMFFSVILFLGIGFLAVFLHPNNLFLIFWLLFTGITGFLLTYKYAPAATKKYL